MRAFFCAVSALLLVACAQTTSEGKVIVEQGTQDLGRATLCCKTLADAKRANMPLEKTTVTIDKTAQAFEFGGTKSFFILYELPRYLKPYSILITSLPSGFQSDAALFIPRVAIYDEHFKPSRYFDEKSLRNRGNTLERTIFINPQNSNEKFLAIFGSDISASIERAHSEVTATPILIGPAVFHVYGGVDKKSILHSAPIGRLDVEVQGLLPAKTSDVTDRRASQ